QKHDIVATVNSSEGATYYSPEALPSSLYQQAALETARILRTPENFQGRAYAKGLVIDPVGCKDRDDAIWAEERNGKYAVHVSIADVAHYVREGMALDHIARLKGFTHYRDDYTTDPLFPNELSQGKFSLLAGQPRLTMTISVGLSEAYEIEEVLIRPTYLVSPADLTYEDAARMREDPSSEFYQTLLLADRISRRIRRSEEPDDHPLRRGTVGEASMHRIIGDFMALANMAVAKYAVENNLPIIYRNFKSSETAGEPTYGYYSDLPEGHAAMGGVYTHTTAPIRRAPDIFAWRRIKQFLDGQQLPQHAIDSAGRVARRINAAFAAERRIS
ncbi:MAG TPA: RNB domain-containing ribonuclease, partial [Patescibacteria group bacterium]|nr:RNB domain-containing ribonuclease [Patescibacteria group bacterium]